MAPLVGIDLRFLLFDERGLGVDLLLGDSERANLGVALEVALGIGEQRLVERLLGCGLVERGLEGPRVDLQQQIALLDNLAFPEADLVDLAIDAGADGHGVPGLRDAQPVEVDGQVLPIGGGDVDGNGGFVRLTDASCVAEPRVAYQCKPHTATPARTTTVSRRCSTRAAVERFGAGVRDVSVGLSGMIHSVTKLSQRGSFLRRSVATQGCDRRTEPMIAGFWPALTVAGPYWGSTRRSPGFRRRLRQA